jgi:hypothetical protein
MGNFTLLSLIFVAILIRNVLAGEHVKEGVHARRVQPCALTIVAAI